MSCLSSLLFISIFILHIIQSSQAQQVSPCGRATNCITCMEAHPSCRWCIAKRNAANGWDPSEGRCGTMDALQRRKCPADKIKGDVMSEVTESIAVPPRDASENGNEGAIQLSPQSVHVKLRPNEEHIIPMTFRLAEDYPVDLYYLMDLSQSMGDDKQKVADLGSQLATEMRKITRDVRLGFGSFVDKVLMPYVNTLEARLATPCTDCESPYSFKHRLTLTENTDEFRDQVEATRISGNLDTPEGGFDAMMQAIVCNNTIGWRNQSRKMLIYSTDASFHSAGDGKLGGVIEPNDGLCHMENNEYTYSSIQDYPSIGQIASGVETKRMNVIFAVTSGQTERYKRLSEIIPGSVTGTLANDSSNVVSLVRENYRKISSSVRMTKRRGNDKNEQLEIMIKSDCNGRSTVPSDTCHELGIGKAVLFNVSLRAKTCTGANKIETFEIHPIGLGESLKITAEVVCECDCDDTEPKSDACSGVGTYECGICKCTKGEHYGDECQCDKSNIAEDKPELDATCIPPANTTLPPIACLERGQCLCGICENCECLPGYSDQKTCKRYSGKYCHCNSEYCPKTQEGDVCANHGKCECRENAMHYCDCDEDYTGLDCSCAKTTTTCIDPNGKPGEMCNGRGKCECGRCVCDILPDGERYTGRYCDDCSTCESKCPEYKPCANCKVTEKYGWPGTYSAEQCEQNCTELTYEYVAAMPEVTDLKKCSPIKGPEPDDCTLLYGYRYTAKTGNTVFLADEPKCPKRINLLALILGVIGGIVLFGIVALLIWKLVTTLHDRREFAKFEQDRQNAKWESGENPIYVQATSTFKNPTYKASEN